MGRYSMRIARVAMFLTIAILAAGALQSFAKPSACQGQPTKTTVLGSTFVVRPQFEAPIANVIQAVRKQLRDEKKHGKFVVYISTPLSATGGGYRPVNI